MSQKRREEFIAIISTMRTVISFFVFWVTFIHVCRIISYWRWLAAAPVNIHVRGEKRSINISSTAPSHIFQLDSIHSAIWVLQKITLNQIAIPLLTLLATSFNCVLPILKIVSQLENSFSAFTVSIKSPQTLHSAKIVTCQTKNLQSLQLEKSANFIN